LSKIFKKQNNKKQGIHWAKYPHQTGAVTIQQLRAGLHYNDYRSELVHFVAQKNIFHVEKGPSLERFTQ